MAKRIYNEDCAIDVEFENPADQVYFYNIGDYVKYKTKENGYSFLVDTIGFSGRIIITNNNHYTNWKGKISNVLKQCTAFKVDNIEHHVGFIVEFSDNTKFGIKNINGKAVRTSVN